MNLDTANLGSNSQPRFKFELIGASKTVVCENVPMEYKSMAVDITRDIDLAGVFVELKIGSVTFTGHPERTFLKELWDAYEYFAVCSLRVSYLNSSRVYIPFDNDFKLDFEKYNEVTISKSRNGIRLKAESTGFVKKLQERTKTKVDLTKYVSIGGFAIQKLYHWSVAGFKKKLNVPNIIVYNNAGFDNDETDSLTASDISTSFSVPFRVIASDYPAQTQSVFLSEDTPIYDNGFFNDSVRTRDLNITNGLISVLFSDDIANASLDFYMATIDTDGTTLLDTTLLGTLTFQADTRKTLAFSKLYSIATAQLLEDQGVVIWGEMTLNSGDFDFTFGTPDDASYNQMTLQDEEINYPANDVNSYPTYHFIEGCLQRILDVQFPLKSIFFGTTDVAKNSIPEYYASEDQERFANFLNGLSVRGLNQDDANNTVSVSFDEIRQAFNSFWNIGVGYDLVSGEERIVVEERGFFYEDSNGLDLSARITDQQIQFEALPDLVYAKINTGYKNFTYELLNGRGEYNTKNERTTIMPGKNLFNNVSDIRGDTKGFVDLFGNPIGSTGSTDVKGDNHNFVMKSQRNGSTWDIEKAENITILNDSSIFGADSFNAFFTPLRNLLRHPYELAVGLIKDPTEFLRFQSSEKLQDLETELTIGGDILTENQDVLVSDLGNPKWKAGQYIVNDTNFYTADFETLIANKYKLIKLSDTKRGWDLKITWNFAINKASINILPKFE